MIIYDNIKFAHSCTVYVGLAQACPNYTHVMHRMGAQVYGLGANKPACTHLHGDATGIERVPAQSRSNGIGSKGPRKFSSGFMGKS